MKKILILPLLLLALLPAVLALGEDTPILADNFTRANSGTVGGDWSTELDSQSKMSISDNKLLFDGGGSVDARIEADISANSAVQSISYTIEMNTVPTSPGGGKDSLSRILLWENSNSRFQMACDGPAGQWTYYNGSSTLNVGQTCETNGVYNIFITYDAQNANVDIYINDTLLIDGQSVSPTSGLTSFWFDPSSNAGPNTGYLDNFIWFNGTYSGGAGDTTPPTITPSTYNMTSSGGCINWQSNPSTACGTNDTTPTVFFSTDEDAWCRMSNNNTHFTGMGAGTNCTGGEGTGNHTCSLNFALPSGEQDLFISCRDGLNNENVTSTSGALRIKIFAGQADADSAIELGISTSTASTATIYDDRQLIATDAAGNQWAGRFDKVVVSGNQQWGIDYVQEEESFTSGLFNLSPVLYVIELANMTETEISDAVSNLINTTNQ